MSDLMLAWDILKKIGAYLVEVPDDAPVVVIKVVKHVYTSLTDFKEFDLAENDYHFLNDMFAKSNLDFHYLLSGKCTQTDYEQFKQAFNESKDKPDWRIYAYLHDIKHQAKCDQEVAIRGHFDQMAKAAVDGEITLISEMHLPILRPEGYARITREDAGRYLKKYNLPLTLLEEIPAATMPEIPQSDSNTTDLYTIEEAAIAIAKKYAWHKEAERTLSNQILDAAKSGALNVRHPHTDMPYRPKEHRKFYELVSVTDLNNWFESVGVPFRLDTAEQCLDMATMQQQAMHEEQEKPLEDTTAISKLLASVGTALLYVKVTELEAAKHMQNNPIANDLLKRYATLAQEVRQSESKTTKQNTVATNQQAMREPQQAQGIPENTKKLTARDKARATISAFIKVITPLAIAKHGDFDPMNAPNKKAFFNAMQSWAAKNEHVKLTGIDGLKDYCSDLVSFQAGRTTASNGDYYDNLLKQT